MSKRVLKFDQNYEKTPLLCGEPMGLVETIHQHYPEIWSLYKQQKSMDWDENEIDFSPCIKDFETADKSSYDAMIYTIAWQWEVDSALSRLAPILSPFISSSELWVAWQKVSENESLHGLSYSTIVRSSFKDPTKVLEEIISISETFDRLENLEREINETLVVGSRYLLGEVDTETAYRQVIKFICALYMLERIQFIASFAVSAILGESGMFRPISSILQLIARDELNIHVELDKAVLRREFATERGKKLFEEIKPEIQTMLDEVVEAEMKWVDFLFDGTRHIVGLNNPLLKDWVLFNAREVYSFFGLNPKQKLPEKNPIPFMEIWLDMDMRQGSAQEEEIISYKSNIMDRDDNDMVFDF